MRDAKTEAEVEKFKEGIVRTLSNFTLYQVKQQYMENKELFDNHQYNIHDHSEGEEAEIVKEEEGEELSKEESAAKFPFYWEAKLVTI